tara:strand:- start:2310 stop:3779 length:1470 start_codon:yes stop_codon:yes gene_type:complete
MIKKFTYFIILCLLLLAGLMLWNMKSFKSKQIDVPIATSSNINNKDAISHLSEAIKYKTISNYDNNQIDAITFLSFHKFLRRTYPLIFKELSERIFSSYSVLLKWEGSKESSKNPILLMAHMDVVPALEIENWIEDPFSGLVKNDFIWGRGALDDKSSLIAILESIEYLLSTGFKPNRDIYISIGHDEENSGLNGNAVIAETLKREGVYFDMVLDEGSIITNNILKGVNRPVAMVGIAEKGYLTIELTSSSNSGHSSMPSNSTAIGKLSKAINNLEKFQMKPKITPALEHFFSYIGPELDQKNQFIISNMTLLSSSIINELVKDPVTASMVRTTIAPTMINAGVKPNILPSEAKAVINFRILQGDNIKKIKEHINKIVNDKDIEVEILASEEHSNPSRLSNVNSPSFNIIHKTIKELYHDVFVAPGLVVATTDSRYYESISKDIYRFVPLILNSEELSMIHGYNEKISISTYLDMIQFYIQLIKNFHVS